MKTIDELLLDQLEFGAAHPVLRTGFLNIDRKEVLLRRGALTLMTARPGMGKTILSCQIAANVTEEGHRAALLSMEHSAGDMIQVLMRGDSAAATPGGIWIEDRVCRLELLEALMHDIPEGPDLIVLDRPSAYSYCRDESGGICREAGTIYGKLKEMAETFHAAVLCTEMADRRVDQEEHPMPRICDIPDWEEIEPFVDTVCAFYSPSYYGGAVPGSGAACGGSGAAVVYFRIGPSRDGCVNTLLWQRMGGIGECPHFFDTRDQALSKTR